MRRVPVCGNNDNVLEVVRSRMAEQGLTLLNKEMTPPHHVPGDSKFVKTLLAAFEMYTGRKGECQSMGGGTYVHNLKNGVAFGAAMPETDNKMHGPDEFAVVDAAGGKCQDLCTGHRGPLQIMGCCLATQEQ